MNNGPRVLVSGGLRYGMAMAAAASLTGSGLGRVGIEPRPRDPEPPTHLLHGHYGKTGTKPAYFIDERRAHRQAQRKARKKSRK